MKKILLTLLIIVTSFFSSTNGQTNSKEFSPNIITYISWQLSNQGCYPANPKDYYNCASYYWKVERTEIPDYSGYYTFNIWFYSNSYLYDYDYNRPIQMSTYIWGIYLYVDGHPLHQKPAWVMFKEKFSPQVLNFKTKNPNPFINMTIEGKKIS